MTTQKTTRADDLKMLKMKDLVAATGVPKSTILHYIREDLLPQPVKTSPNMSLYEPAMVERIGFIKRMQNRYRLPLTAIRKLLAARDRGQDPEQLAALQETIFGRDEGEVLSRRTFLKLSGMEPEHLERCLEAGLIIPLGDDRFDREDLAMGRMYAGMRKLGINPSDGAFYRRLAEEIVDHEMALKDRMVERMPFADGAAMVMQMTRAARAMRAYIIDRVFQRRVMKLSDFREKEERK